MLTSIDEAIRRLNAPGTMPPVTAMQDGLQVAKPGPISRRHPYRFRTMPSNEVDVYRICKAYGVTDPALAYAVELLLLAGQQGRSVQDDLLDALDAIARSLEMTAEDSR
jgi:hypothetical protein